MNDELFAGVRSVRPSPELRARVLAAAEAVVPRSAWWQVLGFGRWDLAWVAAVVVLVAANVALPLPGRPAPQQASHREEREVVALARDLGVPESLLRRAPGSGNVRQDEELLQWVLDERI